MIKGYYAKITKYEKSKNAKNIILQKSWKCQIDKFNQNLSKVVQKCKKIIKSSV